ncbi:hypothetical protein GHT06_018408 [Daphnia sinensis]|uniref:Uncharacterized protein n=1 Tax=Daphnia sinensis TaxID=1820382 RepID=A0AAD5KMG9_9CRUS|nr:hypothetical protein GHT06_018408 [Daphnia sinensis]
MLGQETADGRGVTGHNVLRGVKDWNGYVHVVGYLLFPNLAQQISDKSAQHFLPLCSVVDLHVDEAKNHALMGVNNIYGFFSGLNQLKLVFL